jgi:hypothetical protein
MDSFRAYLASLSQATYQKPTSRTERRLRRVGAGIGKAGCYRSSIDRYRGRCSAAGDGTGAGWRQRLGRLALPLCQASEGIGKYPMAWPRPSRVVLVSNSALRWAFRLPLKGPFKSALVALAECLNDQTGRCDPALTTLALFAGVDQRTARRACRAVTAEFGCVDYFSMGGEHDEEHISKVLATLFSSHRRQMTLYIKTEQRTEALSRSEHGWSFIAAIAQRFLRDGTINGRKTMFSEAFGRPMP